MGNTHQQNTVHYMINYKKCQVFLLSLGDMFAKLG